MKRDKTGSAPGKLKIGYLNINGAVHKHVLLQDLINNSKLDVLCLTETHYKMDFDMLNISRFSVWYKKGKF